MNSRDSVLLAFYCDQCGVQGGFAICLFWYFISYIDTAQNVFVYLFLSIILVKSEKFLVTLCITVCLPHASFFLPVQCKHKCWQNAVLVMDLSLAPHCSCSRWLVWLRDWHRQMLWICQTVWVLEPATYCSEWLACFIVYWEKFGFPGSL